jgi:multidrug efflux system membrane fusion protein
MTMSTEAPVTDRSPEKEPHHGSSPGKSRVRTKKWFIIVGLLLAIVVGLFVGFNAFRSHMIAQFFANNKPPPVTVSAADAKLETLPNLLKGIGDLAAVHQVDVSADVSGRVTEIKFTAGTSVKKGDPLLQLFDAPERADLASFKAQTLAAELALDRAKALLVKQAGTQATVDQAQAAFDQANAAVAKTDAVISQKLVRAPFDGELGVRRVEVGQYLSAGTQIVSLTDLSKVYVNFTATEKDRAILKEGQEVRIEVDAYPGRQFEGKITTIDPQISSDTRNIRLQATIDNPQHLLKPGMFATTSVVLPPEPAKVTVPETAVDYTLYGDSVFLIKETKGADGKSSLAAERVPVTVGRRNHGRVVIAKGLKEGDRVVAVGQLKLQSGVAVEISKDPGPPIPAQAPRY